MGQGNPGGKYQTLARPIAVRCSINRVAQNGGCPAASTSRVDIAYRYIPSIRGRRLIESRLQKADHPKISVPRFGEPRRGDFIASRATASRISHGFGPGETCLRV